MPPTRQHGTDAWLVCLERRADAVLRLVCAPYAGGGVAVFHGWPELLPASLEVWVLRLPGREGRLREPLRTSIDEVARDAAAAVAGLAGPVALFGHSVGASVAFEVARQLRRAHGRVPELLAVSGRAAPHLPLRHPPVHRLPDDEFLTALDRRYQAIPHELREDERLRQVFLPILRADTTLLETYRYRPEPPLACPIVALGGSEDPEVREGDLRAWTEHTSAGTRVTMLPGDHFFLHPQRAVMLAVLAEELCRTLVP